MPNTPPPEAAAAAPPPASLPEQAGPPSFLSDVIEKIKTIGGYKEKKPDPQKCAENLWNIFRKGRIGPTPYSPQESGVALYLLLKDKDRWPRHHQTLVEELQENPKITIGVALGALVRPPDERECGLQELLKIARKQASLMQARWDESLDKSLDDDDAATAPNDGPPQAIGQFPNLAEAEAEAAEAKANDAKESAWSNLQKANQARQDLEQEFLEVKRGSPSAELLPELKEARQKYSQAFNDYASAKEKWRGAQAALAAQKEKAAAAPPPSSLPEQAGPPSSLSDPLERIKTIEAFKEKELDPEQCAENLWYVFQKGRIGDISYSLLESGYALYLLLKDKDRWSLYHQTLVQQLQEDPNITIAALEALVHPPYERERELQEFLKIAREQASRRMQARWNESFNAAAAAAGPLFFLPPPPSYYLPENATSKFKAEFSEIVSLKEAKEAVEKYLEIIANPSYSALARLWALSFLWEASALQPKLQELPFVRAAVCVFKDRESFAASLNAFKTEAIAAAELERLATVLEESAKLPTPPPRPG